MLAELEEIKERYGALRPGLELLAFEDAALPVTIVQVDLLALERKPLPLLREFVLRFAASGVARVDELASLVGLELALVESAVADAVSAGDIAYMPTTRAISLTPRGLTSAQELEAVQPANKQLSFPFDRLTWSLASFSMNELITKKEAGEAGMLILPAAKSAKITTDDTSVPNVNAVLRNRSGRASLEVLSVRKVRANAHRYLPVKILIFGDRDGVQLETSLVVDGVQSTVHDLEILALGGAERLGLALSEPAAAAEVPVEAPEVAEARRATDQGPAASKSPDASDADDEVRSIGVFEHPLLLRHGLTQARKRLLIVAPWVRGAVVDTTFIGNLERRLRSGCDVYIAHGFGTDDSGSDKSALAPLLQ